MAEDLSKSDQISRRLRLIASEYVRGCHFGLRVSSAAFTKQTSLRDNLKAIFNFLTINAFLARAARTGDTLLLDQGLIQAAWSWRFRIGHSQEDDLPVFGSAPDYNLIVLKADQAVIKERLDQRSHNHSRLSSGSGANGEQSSWERAVALSERSRDDFAKVEHSGNKATYSEFSTTGSSAEDLAAAIFKTLDAR